MPRIRKNQILLIKMTPGERSEALALARNNPRRIHTLGKRSRPSHAGSRDVLLIKGTRTADQMQIDKERYDLSTTSGRSRFLKDLNLTGERSKALERILARATPNSRDELGELIRVLNWSEKGRLSVGRLVLSGHYTPTGIEGEKEKNGRLDFSLLAATFLHFPLAAGKITHLMLASCYGTQMKWGLPTSGGLLGSYRSFLPNLETISAYADKAPASRGGAAERDIRRWERASRKMSPSRKAVFGRCRSGSYAQRRRAAALVVSAQKTDSCPLPKSP